MDVAIRFVAQRSWSTCILGFLEFIIVAIAVPKGSTRSENSFWSVWYFESTGGDQKHLKPSWKMLCWNSVCDAFVAEVWDMNTTSDLRLSISALCERIAWGWHSAILTAAFFFTGPGLSASPILAPTLGSWWIWFAGWICWHTAWKNNVSSFLKWRRLQKDLWLINAFCWRYLSERYTLMVRMWPSLQPCHMHSNVKISLLQFDGKSTKLNACSILISLWINILILHVSCLFVTTDSHSASCVSASSSVGCGCCAFAFFWGFGCWPWRMICLISANDVFIWLSCFCRALSRELWNVWDICWNCEATSVRTLLNSDSTFSQTPWLLCLFFQHVHEVPWPHLAIGKLGLCRCISLTSTVCMVRLWFHCRHVILQGWWCNIFGPRIDLQPRITIHVCIVVGFWCTIFWDISGQNGRSFLLIFGLDWLRKNTPSIPCQELIVKRCFRSNKPCLLAQCFHWTTFPIMNLHPFDDVIYCCTNGSWLHFVHACDWCSVRNRVWWTKLGKQSLRILSFASHSTTCFGYDSSVFGYPHLSQMFRMLYQHLRQLNGGFVNPHHSKIRISQNWMRFWG